MSSTTNKRNEQLEKLKNLVDDLKKKLFSIVSSLGWSMESISQDVEKILLCPFNESHRVSEKSAVQHLEKCQWKAEGYCESDLPFSVPTLLSGSSSSIKFDEQLQEDVIRSMKEHNPLMRIEKNYILTMGTGAGGRLIPRTSDRLIAEFTRDERMAMYDYIIANTSQPDIGADITDMNNPITSADGESSSYLELLAQERNLKRRRTKYRGVLTNKKSQVEILREVIKQQMEMLAEFIVEKNYDASKQIDISSHITDKSKSTHQHDYTTKDVYASVKNSTADSNDKQCEDRSFKRLEDHRSHKRFSNDHGFNRESKESSNFYEKKDFVNDSNEYSRKRHSRKDSSDRAYHRSSHYSCRHSQKVQHEKHHKHKSRDREKSRSRDFKHDNRGPKKRRSRDR